MKRKPPAPMTLSAYLPRYFASRQASRTSRVNLRCSIRRFERLTRTPTMDRITDAHLATFKAQCTAEGSSPKRIARLLRDVQLVLRAANVDGLLPVLPGFAARQRASISPPLTWTDEEIARLLQAVGQLPRVYRLNGPPFPARDFARALLLVARDTRLPPSELQRLMFAQIKDERLRLPHLDGLRLTFRRFPLAPDTLDALRAIERPERQLIFVVTKDAHYLYHRLWKLRTAARLAELQPRPEPVPDATPAPAAGVRTMFEQIVRQTVADILKGDTAHAQSTK